MKLESSDFNRLASVNGMAESIIDNYGTGMRSVQMPEVVVIQMVSRFAGGRHYEIEENFDHPVETNRELEERQLDSLECVNEVSSVFDMDEPAPCSRCGNPESTYTSDRILRRKGEEVGEELVSRCRDCMESYNTRPEWCTTDPKVQRWCEAEGIRWVLPRVM